MSNMTSLKTMKDEELYLYIPQSLAHRLCSVRCNLQMKPAQGTELSPSTYFQTFFDITNIWDMVFGVKSAPRQSPSQASWLAESCWKPTQQCFGNLAFVVKPTYPESELYRGSFFRFKTNLNVTYKPRQGNERLSSK